MSQWVKESACSAGDTGGTCSIPGLGRDPLEKEMATRSSILARKSQGQGRLARYSPKGRKELGMTDLTHMLLF